MAEQSSVVAIMDQSTARRLEKTFLTCSVCFEIYKRPKSLPCLHTFCSHCLLSYIESQERYGIRTKAAFLCPICKQETTIRNNHMDFPKWLDELPNNFLVQNMIDSLVPPEKLPATDDDVTEDELFAAPSSSSSNANAVSGETQFSFLTRMFENRPNQPGAYSQYDSGRSRMMEANSFSDRKKPSAPSVPLSDMVMSNPMISFCESRLLHSTYKMAARHCADYRPPMLSDVICLPKHNSIIVLDYDNRCVKYIKDIFLNRNVTTAMEVVGRPCCVALLDKNFEDRIVLSLLNRKRLYFIRVPELELIDVMETSRPYRGLTVLSPTTIMAASPGRPSSFDLIRIDHRCKMVACETISVAVQLPHYITTISEKSFVVADENMNKLCFYEIDSTRHRPIATQKFAVALPQVRRFRKLGGVCYKDGNVYTVDCEKHEVYKIELGKTRVVCETILNTYRPASVCIGPRGEVVVANWEGKVNIFDEGTAAML